ncbi:rod shape-determining protein MreD [Roseinatronobacter sp.]|uniref:rod shape-determining protein MreD n=1 Tax=Roseinatronobacter sp. TaxID=1945755 RepID=UPI0025E1CBF0|nr:rod shape-determining protein MreD [Roseibaca sp.]
MAERSLSSRLWYVALFLGIGALIWLFRLLPLQGLGDASRVPGDTSLSLATWPTPDLMLALCLAWVVRRPDLLPAPLIAGYIFIEDILMMRPPGLWALIVLGATEFLRQRNPTLRGLSFLLEYALIAALMLGMFLLNRMVLGIVMVPQAPLGLSLAQFVGTVATYPLVAAGLHFGLSLRKPATGEVDDLGQKL